MHQAPDIETPLLSQDHTNPVVVPPAEQLPQREVAEKPAQPRKQSLFSLNPDIASELSEIKRGLSAESPEAGSAEGALGVETTEAGISLDELFESNSVIKMAEIAIRAREQQDQGVIKVCEQIAMAMIEQFSHTHVNSQEYLMSLVPLAVISKDVVNELLEHLVTKVRDGVFFNDDLMFALSQVIHYAHEEDLDKSRLGKTLAEVLSKLKTMQYYSSSVLTKNIRSLNVLLDALMQLDYGEGSDNPESNIREMISLLQGVKDRSADDLGLSVELDYAVHALNYILHTNQESLDDRVEETKKMFKTACKVVGGVVEITSNLMAGNIIQTVGKLIDAGRELHGWVGEAGMRMSQWFLHARALRQLAKHPQANYGAIIAYLSELSISPLDYLSGYDFVADIDLVGKAKQALLNGIDAQAGRVPGVVGTAINYTLDQVGDMADEKFDEATAALSDSLSEHAREVLPELHCFQLVILTALMLDSIVRDRTTLPLVLAGGAGDQAGELSKLRQAAVMHLQQLFEHSQAYAESHQLCAYLARQVDGYLSIPEVDMQAAAMTVAAQMYRTTISQSEAGVTGLFASCFAKPLDLSSVWTSYSDIQQSGDSSFSYLPALVHGGRQFSAAVSEALPIDATLMLRKREVEYLFGEGSLHEDALNYISMHGDMRLTRGEAVPAVDAASSGASGASEQKSTDVACVMSCVAEFIRKARVAADEDDYPRLALLKGAVASGKSFSARLLDYLLWQQYTPGVWQGEASARNTCCIPVYIDLAEVSQWNGRLLENHLNRLGFDDEEIRALRRSNALFVFIIDSLGDRGVKTNLYVQNEMARWRHNSVFIMVAQQEYLSTLDDYLGLFEEQPGAGVVEITIERMSLVEEATADSSESSATASKVQVLAQKILVNQSHWFTESQLQSFFGSPEFADQVPAEFAEIHRKYSQVKSNHPDDWAKQLSRDEHFQEELLTVVAGRASQRFSELATMDTDMPRSPLIVKMFCTIFESYAKSGYLEPLVMFADKRSTVEIYRDYVAELFRQGKVRLQEKQARRILPALRNFRALQSFNRFAKDFACMLILYRLTAVIAEGSNYRWLNHRSDIWDSFFADTDTLLCTREGVPLRAIGDQRSFQHGTLLRHFAAEKLFEEIDSFSPTTEVAELYLAQLSLADEHALIDMLLQMLQIKIDKEVSEQSDELSVACIEGLWRLVRQSESPLAAGNAITLLVRLGLIYKKKFEGLVGEGESLGHEGGESKEGDKIETEAKRDVYRRINELLTFAGRNLEGIRCKGAVFDKGDFTETNFSRCQFENASWDGAQLDRANFSHATFVNNLVEERASLTVPRGEVTELVDLDRYQVVLAATKEGYYIWHHSTLIAQNENFPDARYVMSQDKRWVVGVSDGNVFTFDANQKVARHIAINMASCVMGGQGCLGVRRDGNLLYAHLGNGSSGLVNSSALGEKIDKIHLITHVGQEEQWLIDYTGSSTERSSVIRKLHLVTIDENGALAPIREYNSCGATACLPVPGTNFVLFHNANDHVSALDITSQSEDCDAIDAVNQVNVKDFCVSPSGKYLLIKDHENNVEVYVIRIGHDMAESNTKLSLQKLYQVSNVTAVLSAEQFSSDESYIAWGMKGEVQVSHVEKNDGVQILSLEGSRSVTKVTYGVDSQQVLAIADDSARITRRFLIDGEFVERLIKSSGGNVGEEISALGTNFFGVTGLGGEDHALFLERGAVFESDEELLQAAKSGNQQKCSSAVAKMLRGHKFNLLKIIDLTNDSRFKGGKTVFHYVLELPYAEQSIVTMLRFLRQRYPEMPINECDEFGNTPLWSAVRRGLLDCVKCLYEFMFRDSRTETRDEINRYLLGIAVERGQVGVMRYLVDEQSVSLDLVGIELIMECAVINDHADVIRYLVDKLRNAGALNKLKDIIDEKALLHCAVDRGFLEVVEELCEIGANLECEVGRQETPLYIATIRGFVKVCDCLLRHNADATTTDGSGVTVLSMAAYGNRQEICKLLLQHGAKEVLNTSGRPLNTTPMLCAVTQEHEEIAIMLLEAGANFSKVEGTDRDPVMLARQRGLNSFVELVEREYCGPGKDSALTSAASCGDGSEVEACINLGFNINHPGHERVTALSRAAGGGHLGIVNYLISKGADPDITDDNGSCALLSAITGEHEDVAIALVEGGASVVQVEGTWKAPLEFAREKNLTQLVQAIERKQRELQQEQVTLSDNPSASSYVVPGGGTGAAASLTFSGDP